MRVGLVGTGVMGKGIVQILAQSRSITSIIWKGKKIESVVQGISHIEKIWARLIEKGMYSSEEVDVFVSKITAASGYQDLSCTQCIIESVTEDIESKREVFSHLIDFPENIILITNTSSLSITELASISGRPTHFIGLHFFNPAPIMKLIEITTGYKTSKSTIEWAQDFVRKLEKEPVLVKDAPGFLVNRMLIPMLNEAICIFSEGIATADEIDKAMCLGANHPIGPLALTDLIGNDVSLSIMDTLYEETRDTKYRAHPLLRKMVRANSLGRKTGHGFYNYKERGLV